MQFQRNGLPATREAVTVCTWTGAQTTVEFIRARDQTDEMKPAARVTGNSAS